MIELACSKMGLFCVLVFIYPYCTCKCHHCDSFYLSANRLRLYKSNSAFVLHFTISLFIFSPLSLFVIISLGSPYCKAWYNPPVMEYGNYGSGALTYSKGFRFISLLLLLVVLRTYCPHISTTSTVFIIKPIQENHDDQP